MKLTLDLIESGSTQRRSKTEEREDFLRKVKHISVVGRDLQWMDAIHICHQLAVLDLSDNSLTCIEGLNGCPNLSRLFLQDNAIEEISGLDEGLEGLSVLNLSGNKIITLKGLENLPSLEILHMDRQKTQQDFLMDPASLEALGTSLKTLTLSDCKVSVVEALSLLFELEDLYLPKNQLARVEDLEHVLTFCTKLKVLDVRENPVASNIRLRERLVMASESLETLSGRAIKDVERQFLKSKAQAKRSRVPKAQNSIPGENAEEEDPFKPIPHLPPYATQYRDLLLQELDSKARKNEEGRKRHAPIENGFLSLAKAAERK